MIDLNRLLTAHEKRLAADIQALADKHGFAKQAQAGGKSWQQSIAVLTQAILASLESQGIDGCHASPEVACDDDHLAEFALATSRRHRKNGISLAMFMAMLKFYRQVYLDLIRETADHNATEERGFVNRFFDRMEISQCVDWVRFAEEEKLLQAKASHQAMANEKNRFLTLFDSLICSVFLLDTDLRIEIMNDTAIELVSIDGLPKELGYARPSQTSVAPTLPEDKASLKTIVPWLYEAIPNYRTTGSHYEESRFDISEIVHSKKRYFNVAVSPVTDNLGGLVGTTVVVDDVTERVEVELQLARERNMAAEYLDVVGAIVLAVDASGGIMLLNQTGCDILGYENSEITGQNWIDTAIPEEERDALKDYFYSIISDDIALDDRHTNSIITRSGERVLIEWNNRLLRNEGGLPIGILASGVDVTERNQVEEALAEKELWLRNTFVALNEAVLILTADRQIIDANPAAETMFQMTHQELTSLPIEALHISDESSNEYGELTAEAFKKGIRAEFEYTLRRKNGDPFPTDNSVSLISNDEGKPLGVVNVIRDISQRKRADMILRKSEEKFRRIFETMKDGFIVTDLSGTIQMVNPATCLMMGYTESELIGQDMSVLYANPDERQDLRHQLATKGAVQTIQLSATRSDGSIVTVEANAHVVLDDEGKPIAMEGTFRDISARLIAEQMLREREKLYRAFFENNHAIMLLEDPKTGDIVDANPAASEFYGYTVEEMRELRMSQISALTEEEIFQEMFTARNEKRSYFIFKHLLASGEIRDVEVYSGPILVRGKQLLYSVIHDVTARIRLERDMKRMATTDSLTGVNNRHQFFLLAKQEFKRAKRYEHPLAVVMLDIDYFKSINDEYGHQIGDEVLKALAQSASSTLREADIFGRLGGEEFAAILPETDAGEAKDAADRLRIALAELAVPITDGTISFTVSVGVSMARRNDTLREALNRADEALYRAKRGGRNRVITD